MNLTEALGFLQNNQPMPSDKMLSDDNARLYHEVMVYFKEHPDPACIPFFLNSFGDGDGFGTYQLVEDVIAKYKIEEVKTHIIDVLLSNNNNLLYWTLQIMTRFSDICFIPYIAKVLNNEDAGIRFFCLINFESIYDKTKSKEIIKILTDFKNKEKDVDNLEVIESILNSV